MTKRKPIVIHGLVTEIEWQCAFNASGHADPNQRITLEYETPDGDLTLIVEDTGACVLIRKGG